VRYLAVQWHHTNPEDPVALYSEIDDAGWEQRKVEIYADGIRNFADRGQRTGTTQLGLGVVPPTDEIAANPEFSPREISREEFETIWRNVVGSAA
jgi:hypothetical protein